MLAENVDVHDGKYFSPIKKQYALWCALWESISLKYFHLRKKLYLFHILHTHFKKPTEIIDFMNIVLLSTPFEND